ncbi:MAG: hypothetical protein V4717_01895 [Bacteroidota bacterium]
MKLIFTIGLLGFLGVVSGQNVGIGIITPEAKLHVFNSDNSAVLAETNGGSKYAGLEAKTNGGANDRLLIRKWMPGSSGTAAGISLSNLSQVVAGAQAAGLMVGVVTNNPLYFTTNNQERMRIAADGKVGIGTNAPLALLDVRSDTGSVIVRGLAHVSTKYIAVQLAGNAGTTEFVRFNHEYVGAIAGIPLANVSALYASGGPLIVGNSTPDPLHFITNGTPRMAVTSDGNVGIGTSSPVGNLHVKSNAISDVTVETTSGSAVARVNFQTSTGMSEVGRFGNSVALTINGVNYNNLTRLYATGGPVATGTSGNHPLYLLTGDFPRIMINGDGNIGVNVVPTTFTQFHVKRSGPNAAIPAAELGAIYGENGAAEGSGIIGISAAPRTGASSYAGVTGMNINNSTDMFGVIGSSSGTSAGVNYSAGVGGYGDYGVLGYSQSGTGAGIIALHSAGKTALEVNNGFIKATGNAGNKTAFKHTVTAVNAIFNLTSLSYNGAANTDILIVTHDYATGIYLNKPFGVYWTGATWAIYLEDSTAAMPLGIVFNVLVIKQ